MTHHLVVLLLTVALAMASSASAQPAGKIPQIGVLFLGSENADITQAGRAFREGLRDLGWLEGRNVGVRLKFANLGHERLGGLATELVQERVDVIVAVGTVSTLAARRATSSIPIVMAGVGDPVGTGLVKDLARPEANITGVSLLTVDLTGKRLELIKEAVPKVSQVGVLYAEAPSSLIVVKHMQALAPRFGIQIRTTIFSGVGSVPDRMSELRSWGAQALIVPPTPVVDEARGPIAEAAIKHRIPTMFAFREYVEAGGFMSYGPDFSVQQRRAARYVDLILKGARAGDLPIEQPTHLELVINRGTARALGVTIPPAVLLRADRVIE